MFPGNAWKKRKGIKKLKKNILWKQPRSLCAKINVSFLLQWQDFIFSTINNSNKATILPLFENKSGFKRKLGQNFYVSFWRWKNTHIRRMKHYMEPTAVSSKYLNSEFSYFTFKLQFFSLQPYFLLFKNLSTLPSHATIRNLNFFSISVRLKEQVNTLCK